MKHILLPVTLLVFSLYGNAQNVGVGNLAPTEKLHVDSGHVKIGVGIVPNGKSNLLKFGDADYCHVGEVGDDSLELKAKYITILPAYGNPYIQLLVNGNLRINDGTQGAGKILVSDATGQTAWQNPGAFAIPFKGTNGPNQIVGSGLNYLVNFDTEEYDYGNAFQFSTFNAPATGVYHFDAAVYWNLTSTGSSYALGIHLAKSGNLEHATEIMVPASSPGPRTQTISADIFLTTGQTVQLRAYHASGVNQTIICNNGVGKFTYFNGRRVY